MDIILLCQNVLLNALVASILYLTVLLCMCIHVCVCVCVYVYVSKSRCGHVCYSYAKTAATKNQFVNVFSGVATLTFHTVHSCCCCSCCCCFCCCCSCIWCFHLFFLFFCLYF